MVMMAVLMIVVLMVVLAVLMIVVFMVMMAVLMIVYIFQQIFHAGLMFQGAADSICVKLLPWRGDNRRLIVLPAQEGNTLFHGFRLHHLRPADDDRRSACNLVFIKFPEIFQVHFCLFPIHHGNPAFNLDRRILFHRFHRTHDIGEFSDPGGFNQYPVRRILVQNLFQSNAEISHQRTADAARVHLGDLNTGFF